MKDILKRFGILAKVGKAYFFPTIGAAISGYLASHEVAWIDWEDRIP